METARLSIKRFDLSMAGSVYGLSQEKENKKNLPDEVFGSEDDARQRLADLIGAYDGKEGPFVYPVFLKMTGLHIGHVEASRVGEGVWEIGYHIGEDYTGNGYATEAVRTFLPFIMDKLGISEICGICRTDNAASAKVLENCGFQLTEQCTGRYQGERIPIKKFKFTM